MNAAVPVSAVPIDGRRAFVRDAALIARFELGEALRSKLLVVMLLLFVGAGALGAYGYTELVGQIEDRAAAVMNAPAARRPGAALGRLRETTSYRDMLRVFFKDEQKADYFARLPPIVVFYAWAALLFTPWLILFTSAETISTEVASRSIRYSLLRTGRLAYALGKTAGQALIVLGVTALAALVFFAVAWARLAGFEAGATATGLLSYWPRVVLYNLPFLAWAMFASMVTASANLSRIVSLGGAVLLSVLSTVAKSTRVRVGPISEAAWDLVANLTPYGHNDGLFYPAGGGFWADVATCLGLCVLYFAAGFAILRRRDV